MREPYKKVSASFFSEGLNMVFRTFTKHSKRVLRNTWTGIGKMRGKSLV
jgi:hypothetical protein